MLQHAAISRRFSLKDPRKRFLYSRNRFVLQKLAFATSGNKREPPAFSLWYPVLGGLAVTTLGAIKYVNDYVGGTEGLARTISFYSVAIPKYVQYRYHMWLGSPDEVWDDLHRETSAWGLEKMLELGGFYIKSGQMCASNIGDAFPPIWQETMSVLQDNCPPQDFSVVKEVLDSELKFDQTFASFEETPIGAASIGQVHRATLKDGTAVVVKVRYPNVERLLRGDVRTIAMFAQVAQPVHVPALREIEKQFQNEFDYRREALQLDTVQKNLAKAGLAGPNKACIVPKAYLDLCTTRVLVMEELKGKKLAVELREDLQRQADQAGLTPNEYVQEMEKRYGHKSRTALEYNLHISSENSKRRLRNTRSLAFNSSVGWIPGVSKAEYDNNKAPLNHAQLVDDLLMVHGHEVLVDGYFNGDPHPGNILLCHDQKGRPQLGLIDYGQVKQLSKDTRHLFARLVVAMDDDNKKEIVKLMKEAGFISKNMDPEVIYKYAKVGYDQDNAELTGGRHIQLFMEDLEAQDPIIQLPEDFIMVSRATLILRGLCHALNQSRSVAHAWRPIAERVLKENI